MGKLSQILIEQFNLLETKDLAKKYRDRIDELMAVGELSDTQRDELRGLHAWFAANKTSSKTTKKKTPEEAARSKVISDKIKATKQKNHDDLLKKVEDYNNKYTEQVMKNKPTHIDPRDLIEKRKPNKKDRTTNPVKWGADSIGL